MTLTVVVAVRAVIESIARLPLLLASLSLTFLCHCIKEVSVANFEMTVQMTFSSSLTSSESYRRLSQGR
jgi:hypothetical protein